MTEQNSSSVQDFERQYPEVWKAFATPGEECHKKGEPLDQTPRRLVTVGAGISSHQR
jgi:hypothetical protein